MVEVRLRIVEALIPVASRHGITEIEEIVSRATALEKYVVGSEPSTDAVTPDASNKRTLKLPRKDKPADTAPAFLTPPMVDKSNQALG
jgi:hypothetical protein